MAGFQLNDGQMFIFKNERKIGQQPDYRGSTRIDGTEYWISCWIKEGKNGKFFSCAVQDKEQSILQQPTVQVKETKPEPFDNDLPF